MKNNSNQSTLSQSNWKNSPLLSGISEEHLAQLYDNLEKKHFEQGEYIIRDGDAGDDIFIIEEGEVEIRKDGIKLASKSSGDHFGAMAMLDNSMRSADVVTVSETATIKALSVTVLKSLDRDEIYQKIMTNHIKEQQSNLRNMNVVTVAEVKAKLEESQARLLAGGFFVSLIFGLIFYQWLLGAFIEYSAELKDEKIMTVLNPIMMIIICVAAYYRAIKSGLPLSDFGLNLNNWKKNVIQSLVWSSFFLVGVVFFKWLATLYLPSFEGKPVFDYSETENFSFGALIIIYTVYAVLSPVQEFIARGVLQTSLEKLLTGDRKVVMSIFLSNLTFSSFHIHLDMRFALLTLIPGTFWGIMYYKQKSLVGVSISHAIIGIFVFIFLGLV